MIEKLEAVDGFFVGTIESQTPVGLGVVIDNPTGECMKVLRVFYRLQPSIRKLITKVYFKCDRSDTKRLLMFSTYAQSENETSEVRMQNMSNSTGPSGNIPSTSTPGEKTFYAFTSEVEGVDENKLKVAGD